MRLPVRRLRHLPLCLALAAAGMPMAHAATAEVAPGLREMAAQDGAVDSLIVLSAKAPKHLLRPQGDYRERRRALVDLLRATAEVSQADLRAWLDAEGVAYRPFWIVNSIEARLTPGQIEALAARADVAALRTNTPIALARPADGAEALPMPQPASIEAVEWGIHKVRAPLVWAAGYTGQGVVVAGQDTGIRWTHNALKAKYRGWNGATADHNYNWRDAVHGVGNGTCAGDRPAPCDDNGHGTHTVGTMVGDDGGSNQVGVAPGARWIGCRNMNSGVGTPVTYNECAQFFLAPTDAAGQNPDPDRAPDVINNSWGCPADEGCTAGNEVREAIENLVAGGIVFVAAAGNGGSLCGTILDPPATYDASLTIGSMTSLDGMSGFSSRGPAAAAATLKPDVVAPGSTIRSATRGSDTAYGNSSGTSMATPHVAGVVALLMSVDPGLRGDPVRVAHLLRSTAVPLTSSTQICGGIPATTIPNPVQGYGRVDAWSAFLALDRLYADDFD